MCICASSDNSPVIHDVSITSCICMSASTHHSLVSRHTSVITYPDRSWFALHWTNVTNCTRHCKLPNSQTNHIQYKYKTSQLLLNPQVNAQFCSDVSKTCGSKTKAEKDRAKAKDLIFKANAKATTFKAKTKATNYCKGQRLLLKQSTALH